MVDEVGVKARGVDILLGEIARQLMDDGADHLQMPKFLRSNIRQQSLQLGVGHGVTLAQVAQRRAELAVRAAVLADDQRGQLGVRVLDADGVLQLLLIDKHQSDPPSSHGHGLSSQV